MILNSFFFVCTLFKRTTLKQNHLKRLFQSHVEESLRCNGEDGTSVKDDIQIHTCTYATVTAGFEERKTDDVLAAVHILS